MELNNIENQINQKLGNREIQPSAQAWDRLDAMLTVAEEKKWNKVAFWNLKYFAIAAAFILVGGLVFIQLDNSKGLENGAVVTKEIEKKTKQNTEIETNFNPTSATKIAISDIKPANFSEKSNLLKPNRKYSKKINPQSKNEINNQKSNQEIAEVGILKSSEKIIILSISDAELLANVDKATLSKNQKKVQINSKDLLFQATSEINQEYRETNFQKLKRNFETVKVAISNRNNQ